MRRKSRWLFSFSPNPSDFADNAVKALLAIILVNSFVALALATSSPRTHIMPGEIWPDDRGRHIQAHDGGKSASIADLSLLGADGQNLDSQLWTIAGMSSQELDGETAGAGNAIDGQISNHWSSEWKSTKPSHPHWIVIDLGREKELFGFIYVPRQGSDSEATGRIKSYQAYLGSALEPVP